MTDRERFDAMMGYRRPDRACVYYFGQWEEARQRWLTEGLSPDRPIVEQVGMDADWEEGMWDTHGLAYYGPIHRGEGSVIEEADTYRVIRHASGAITRESKIGASIPQHLKEALEPTRESWNLFRKSIDPTSPERQPDGQKLAAKARELNARDSTVCCFGGSLYGWARDWMGVEALSMLSYDDPSLYEEVIDYVTQFVMTLNRPILAQTRFEFAYIFEDCCGKSGPLFSPATYRQYYHKYYVKLVEFYKSQGVKYVLLDSDGDSEMLIPCWLDSGIDIIFPIEVGTWHGDPVRLRQKYGRRLRMMGGVDKHLITGDPRAMRTALERLKPVVDEGGYIPLPDHRIPPNCSLDQFNAYVAMFKSVFNTGASV